MGYNLTKLEKTQRVGVLGGIFDPVHFGHLNLAQYALEQLGLDIVLFVPSGKPSHKDYSGITPAAVRLKMLSLAVKANPRFKVTDIEAKNPAVSYTADTLKTIKSFMPEGSQLFFLMGEDNVSQIVSWKNYESFCDLCKIVAVPRKNPENSPQNPDFLYLSACAPLDISSTFLRQRVREGASVAYLTTEAVCAFIAEKRLYKLSRLREREITRFIEKTLTKKRYLHTVGTVDEAVKLARLYGEDEKKARLAALLHDAAKEFTPRKKAELCAKYHIKLSKYMLADIDFAHGLIASKMAKERFGVFDKDILNAIAYHTSGRAGMSRLEKIIFLADYIEAYRPLHDNLILLREMAYKDLDKAVIMKLSATIARLKERGAYISPRSKQALKYFSK